MPTVYPPVAPGHTTVAIDLDGVLAENVWPSPVLGEPIDQGIRMAKHYWNLGYEVVIYTARPESHRAAVEDFLYDNDLTGVIYDVVFNKPRAGLYIDDRATKFVQTEIHVHADDCTMIKEGVCVCR